MTRSHLHAAAALAAGAFLAVPCASAGAYPDTHHTPHIALGRPTPPTTAECFAQTGFAC